MTTAEIKLHMTNERTLIAWVRLAATLGVSAMLLRTFARPASTAKLPKELAPAQGAAAVLIAVLALSHYRHRARLIREREHVSFFASWLPAIAGATVVLAIVVSCSRTMQSFHEWWFHAQDCSSLQGFELHPDAPRPHAFITFHGSRDPRAALCHPSRGVSGVHAFSIVDGTYVGPVTDQLAALVKQPRGILATPGGMLLLADASGKSSSIAVFGPRANASASHGEPAFPFRGRISPPKTVRAAFSHPYGLTWGDGGILVAAQDGQSVLRLDPQTGSVEVLHQVASGRHHDESGSIRGVAADARGCAYVSDKHANAVHMYCGSRLQRRIGRLHIERPIAVVVDGDTLVVGSLGGGERRPSVLTFALRPEGETHDPAPQPRLRIEHPRLQHPAGIHVYRKRILVLEQVSKALFAFDLETGHYHDNLVSALPDTPEAFVLEDENGVLIV